MKIGIASDSSTGQLVVRLMRSVVLAVICAIALPAATADRSPPDSSDVSRGLDLSGIDLTPYYQTHFSEPLRFIKESELFTNGRRTREPPPDIDWVLEGSASAAADNGRLTLKNDGDHLVFWNTRRFPADFLLEFGVLPKSSDRGLNIVFFAATGRDERSIFDLGQQRRDGEFRTYHSGGLNAYHVSYWATSEEGIARGTANIRKNFGFHLVAMGRDFIAGQGPGPHRVRILKIDGRIDIEVNGKIAARWHDDGRTLGPILQEGFIGLRQMARTQECSYTHFAVWAARKQDN